MSIYLRTSFVTIAKDPALNCLMISWHGLCSSTQYRQGMLMAAEIVRKEKVKHWISDNTDGRVIAMSDHHWLFKNLILKGSHWLDSISAVQSRNIFRNIAVEKLVEQSQQIGIQINRFDTNEEAEHWIRTNFCNSEHVPETALELEDVAC